MWYRQGKFFDSLMNGGAVQDGTNDPLSEFRIQNTCRGGKCTLLRSPSRSEMCCTFSMLWASPSTVTAAKKSPPSYFVTSGTGVSIVAVSSTGYGLRSENKIVQLWYTSQQRKEGDAGEHISNSPWKHSSTLIWFHSQESKPQSVTNLLTNAVQLW
jgi:hypothetical protein